MQSSASSDSPFSGDLGGLLRTAFAQRDALLAEIGKNPGLSEEFKKRFQGSYNKDTATYSIIANDSPLISQCKSLINIINIIEKNPNLINALAKYLQDEKGRASFLASVANNKSDALRLDHEVDALIYYTEQNNRQLVELMPQTEPIFRQFSKLIDSFNVVSNIIYPFSEKLSQIANHDDNQLSQYLNNLSPVELQDLPKVLRDVSQHAYTEMQRIKQKAVASMSSMNIHSMLDSAQKSAEEKEKLQTNLMLWYHFAKSTCVSNGIDSTLIDNQLKKLAAPVFGDNYITWKIASDQVNLANTKNDFLELIQLKSLIENETLSFELPIRELMKYRNEFSKIKSFDITPLILAIDNCIDTKTNQIILNKRVDDLKHMISDSKHKIDSYHDKPEKADKKKKHELIIEKAMAELKELQSIKSEIFASIEQPEAKIKKYYPDKEGRHSTKNLKESKTISTDKIAKKDSEIYKLALGAIHTAIEANQIQQKSYLHNIVRLEGQIQLSAALDAGQKAAAKDKVAILKPIIQEAQQNLVRKKPSNDQPGVVADIKFISATPVTSKLRKIVDELTKQLSPEALASLYDKDNTLKPVKDKDMPTVKVIKLYMKLLTLVEKNTRNFQQMQTYKTNRLKTAMKFITSDFSNDLQAIYPTITELKKQLSNIHSIAEQNGVAGLTVLPIFSQIEAIMAPVISIYEQFDLGAAQSISASSASSASASPARAPGVAPSGVEKLQALLNRALPIMQERPSAEMSSPKSIANQVIVLLEKSIAAYSNNSVIDLTQALLQAKDLYNTMPDVENGAELDAILQDMITLITAKQSAGLAIVEKSIGDIFQQVDGILEQRISIKQIVTDALKQNKEPLQQNLNGLISLEKMLGFQPFISGEIMHHLSGLNSNSIVAAAEQMDSFLAEHVNLAREALNPGAEPQNLGGAIYFQPNVPDANADMPNFHYHYDDALQPRPGEGKDEVEARLAEEERLALEDFDGGEFNDEQQSIINNFGNVPVPDMLNRPIVAQAQQHQSAAIPQPLVLDEPRRTFGK